MRWPAAVSVAVAAIVLNTVRVRGARTQLEARPKYIRACELPHNAIANLYARYSMVGRAVTFFVNGTVTRSVSRLSKIRLTADKCDEVVSSSRCTPFQSMDFPDACAGMMAKGMPWSKIVADVQPKLGCPVKPGTYSITNGSLSMEPVNALAATVRLEGPVWMLRAHFLDGKGGLHLCLEAAGEFFRVRNRPKNG